MKRGYFVYPADEFWGVGVVATSAKEAKKLAFASGELITVDWIDIRVRWQLDAVVNDLLIGVVDNEYLCLKRGLYDYLVDCFCEICGKETMLRCHNGKALCDDCIEKEYKKLEEVKK
jgi:hypothetical protein